ncbi:hypothetical protein RclHR1_07280010 [Rhizophagus clarus]|uniref:MARVEL domain-containing protein n=1 Tax=Rhizophagus clarus TaxID=94130 RepID=A0A2Z6S258_9GLOM|nr:hypothetical protein RclHR1_07280010 [Rhizophagus clarus]GES94961.1 hypothetical protein GLOIN_2v1544385 [Rhizophagus clarus]
MNSQSASIFFRGLRAAEILIVFICIILELVEYAAFQVFYLDQGFTGSAYFNAGITKSIKDENVAYYNGAKIFFYIVLILTLADSGVYLSRFCRFNMGPYKRDISVNAFFMLLWFISGIANIYPSFKGYGYTCDNLHVIGENNGDATIPNAVARECNAKVTIISFGWINGFLFLATTLIAMKLWKERQERYEGERRVEALREVVYKYKPRPNTMVQVDQPEQVMIYKTYSKREMKRGTPTYIVKTSQPI